MKDGITTKKIENLLEIEVEADTFNLIFSDPLLMSYSLVLGKKVIKIHSKVMKFEMDLFDFIYSDVFLVKDTTKIDISKIFEKFRLDLDLINEEKYMNEQLFAAPTRALKENELFFQLISVIDKIPKRNKFLGGIITLLSYRISDAMEERKRFIEKIFDIKVSYDNQVALQDEVAVRWYFSSSSSFSSILLMSNKVQEAEKILNMTLEKNWVTSLATNIGWNQAICLLNLSIISFPKDIDHAINTASLAYDVCKNNISYMASSQNTFVLFQTLDCKVMIDLMQNSLILLARYRAIGAPPTKFAQIKINRKHRFDFSPLIRRFSCKNEKKYLSFFINASEAVNDL